MKDEKNTTQQNITAGESKTRLFDAPTPKQPPTPAQIKKRKEKRKKHIRTTLRVLVLGILFLRKIFKHV